MRSRNGPRTVFMGNTLFELTGARLKDTDRPQHKTYDTGACDHILQHLASRAKLSQHGSQRGRPNEPPKHDSEPTRSGTAIQPLLQQGLSHRMHRGGRKPTDAELGVYLKLAVESVTMRNVTCQLVGVSNIPMLAHCITLSQCRSSQCRSLRSAYAFSQPAVMACVSIVPGP